MKKISIVIVLVAISLIGFNAPSASAAVTFSKSSVCDTIIFKSLASAKTVTVNKYESQLISCSIQALYLIKNSPVLHDGEKDAYSKEIINLKISAINSVRQAGISLYSYQKAKALADYVKGVLDYAVIEE